MAPKSFLLTEQLATYLLDHSAPLDPIERSLIATTAELGGVAGMQIAPEQGRFMGLLASLLGARTALEIGTFTGYSALQLVRGMGPGSTLTCLDVSEEWTSIGRAHWERAGISDQIELLLGPALSSLETLPADQRFDLIFIDADKPNYLAYYEAVVPRLNQGGVLLVDNVLWHGQITDPSDTSEHTVAIRHFNDHVAADPRTESTILPIGDGLTMVRLARS